MTCRNCNKLGHITAFCQNVKTADVNVQDSDALQAETLEDDYYADLFLCKDQEHRSVSLQIKDGINGGRIPKDWVLLDSQLTTDVYS
jgi:hypothetical protein